MVRPRRRRSPRTKCDDPAGNRGGPGRSDGRHANVFGPSSTFGPPGGATTS